MRLVVTGGSGRLGQYAIRELLAHDHTVLSLDRLPPPTALCPSWVVDLTRAGDVYQALRDAEGVVHLGAWQAPGLTSDTETFANNVTATYNVLKAATDLGVRRAVLASSVAAYGFIYAPRMPTPDYLPLDEEHPCRPQDPYGLSKVVGETLGDSFARLAPITIVSLRIAGVNFDPTYQRYVARWRTPAERLGGFWSYIDARDAAVACRLAVEAPLQGHQVFNVAAPTSLMREPTAELARRYVPDLPRIKEGYEGNFSGLDPTKADRVLGFRAEHLMEQYVGPDGAPLGPTSPAAG
jgi:nucleoside-diphosphate-sugar epimerase